MGSRPDRGQAVMLMVAVVACCALVAIAVGRLGGHLVDRQRAQTAADAAALAGVAGGRIAADDIAARNGAVLTAYDEVIGGPGVRTVTVTVTVDAVSATARATNGP